MYARYTQSALWNTLRCEMSLVGPRPEYLDFGLGPTRRADRVRVPWPAGGETVLEKAEVVRVERGGRPGP